MSPTGPSAVTPSAPAISRSVISRSQPARPRTCSSFAAEEERFLSVFADFQSATALSSSDDSSLAETNALTSETISKRPEPKSEPVRYESRIATSSVPASNDSMAMPCRTATSYHAPSARMAIVTTTILKMVAPSVAKVSRFSGSMAIPRTTRYQCPRSIANVTLPRMATLESAPAIDQRIDACVASRHAITGAMT